MKTLLAAMLLLLPLGLLAQQAPASPATPPMAAPPTPMAAAAPSGGAANLPAALAPDPNAPRVYVQGLQGPDAAQIAGLIEQDLFNSKRVVVTEIANNASLILKGTIYRRVRASAKPTKRSRVAHSGRHVDEARRAATDATADAGGDTGGVSYVNPKSIPSADAGATDSAASSAPSPAYSQLGQANSDRYGAGVDDSADLPSLSSLLNPGITDLSRYQYRLDLELVDPDGDLIWISGRGLDAPSFTTADQAVQNGLNPMLQLLEKYPKRGDNGAVTQQP